MGIFKAVKDTAKAGWNAMNKYQKIKFVSRMMCSLGSGFIGGTFINRYFDQDVDFGAVEKATVFVTSYGLSLAAGNAAADAIDKLVDACEELHGAFAGEPTEEAEDLDKMEETL